MVHGLAEDTSFGLAWYTHLMQAPRYDVAISFLSQDEPAALKLHGQLGETFFVFVYSKQQEQLAGTDGLESFRLAFLSQSRLVVVLYREGWGKTKWTAIEELAIKDRMFEGGWDSLLFVAMDGTSPAWLPKTHVRLDYSKFAQDLVGAIKLRVQELGGTLKVETALDRAQRMNEIALARTNRERKLSYEGNEGFHGEWTALCDCVEEKLRQIAEVNPHLDLEYNRGSKGIGIRTNLGSIKFALLESYPYQRGICLQTFLATIFLKQDFEAGRMYFPGNEPHYTSERIFHFDYDAALSWCRREGQEGELLTTESLSELLMNALLEAHRTAEDGGKPRKTQRNRVGRTR
jgi:hypothetical protein